MLDDVKKELEEETTLKTEADLLNEMGKFKEEIFTMLTHVASYEQRIQQLEYLISMAIDCIPELREEFEKIAKENKSEKEDKSKMSPED